MDSKQVILDILKWAHKLVPKEEYKKLCENMVILEENKAFVLSSKGDKFYTILDNRCDCPAFTYRGACKHLGKVPRSSNSSLQRIKDILPSKTSRVLELITEDELGALLRDSEVIEIHGQILLLK